MGARVELIGMEQFRAALRQLPEDLAREGGAIVEAYTDEAARSVQAGYPEGPTGNLKRGVTRTFERGRFGVNAVVRSRAKHATIFEKGTQRRQTSQGWNRGAMPQPPEAERAIPKFIRIRARMTAALIELVRQAGLQVDR